MKDSLPLEFLYNTAPGRSILKLLVQPSLSKPVGKLLDSGISRLIVDPFIEKNNISLDGISVPDGGFESFNDFFTRRRSEVVFDTDKSSFCSPCDGFLTAHEISSESVFHIKNTDYSVAGLLKSPKLAACFSGGTALIFRLTPQHYHRYHFFDDGEIIAQRKIPGVLHTVRPIATEKYPVYIQNSREYSILRTENFGIAVQMEIGALLVGRICNTVTGGSFTRGQEKGRFEFGGSTVAVLLRKNQVSLYGKFTGTEDEVPVSAGECLGTKPEIRQ